MGYLIIFAGKGTQCAKIVEDFHFCHLSGLYPPQTLKDKFV